MNRFSANTNLRIRCNNLINHAKDDLVRDLMGRHQIEDFEKALMLFIRCLNDDSIREAILAVSDEYFNEKNYFITYQF